MTETNLISPEMPNKVAAEVIMKNDTTTAEAQKQAAELKATEDKRGWLDKLVNRKKKKDAESPPDPKKVIPRDRLNRMVSDRNNARNQLNMGPEEFGMNLNEDKKFQNAVAVREKAILAARGPNKLTGATPVLSPTDRMRARQEVVNAWVVSKDPAVVGRLDLYQKEGIYLKPNGEVNPDADPFYQRHMAIVDAETDAHKKLLLQDQWVKSNRSKAEVYANCDKPNIAEALKRIDSGQETKIVPPDPNKPVETDSVMKARRRADLQQQLAAVEARLQAAPTDTSIQNEKRTLENDIAKLNKEPTNQNEINDAVTGEVNTLFAKEAEVNSLEAKLASHKAEVAAKTAKIPTETDASAKATLIAEVVKISAEIPGLEAQIASTKAEIEAIVQDLKKPETKGNKVNAGLLLALTALAVALPIIDGALKRK